MFRASRWGLLLLGVCGAGRWVQGQNLVLVPTIQTVAGTGVLSSTGDGGLATSATVASPLATVKDGAGNLYFVEAATCLVRRVDAVSGVISRVAGSGCGTYAGDGSSAMGTPLGGLSALAMDAAHNLYLSANNRILKLSAATGTFSTVAGTGVAGYSGDNGLAVNAKISAPQGLAVDASGNVYLADTGNFRIRRVDTTGTITTVVGTGLPLFTADGAAGTSTAIGATSSVGLDGAGNLYFYDVGNVRVRVLSKATGQVSTVAGNGLLGLTGDGGLAVSATLGGGTGASIDVDLLGNVYIADLLNNRVREVTKATGLISTIAGAAGSGLLSVLNVLSGPQEVKFNAVDGSVVISATTGNLLQQILPNRIAFPSTAIGSSTQQNVFLMATAPIKISSITAAASQGNKQEFAVGAVTGCAVDGTTVNPTGTVCQVPLTFAPGYTGTRSITLQAVTSTGTLNVSMAGVATGGQLAVLGGNMATTAGTGAAGFAGDGASAVSASLNSPRWTAVDAAGNIYVADTGNHRVRKIAAATGAITTIAGNGTACASPTAACGDGGAATSASLKLPHGIAVDGSGNVYIADTGDNRVRVVNAATGAIATFAGTGTASYTGDSGLATWATLNAPLGLAVDAAGNVTIADSANAAVRRVSGGVITTIAGNGTACATPTNSCGDGGAATAANLNLPAGVALDAANNVYVADSGDARLRVVHADTGILNTVAGTGSAGYSGDGGPAISATLSRPYGVAVDSANDVYFSDVNNGTVRMVNAATGVVVTVAGSSTACSLATAACGDGLGAMSAAMNGPRGIALDSNASLLIADAGDNRLRTSVSSAMTLGFASTAVQTTSADSPKAVLMLNTGNTPLSFPAPASGTNASVSADFSLGNSSSCPVLSSTSSNGSLPMGAMCNYLVSFTPAQAGSITGSLVVTDNAANPTLSVSLGGTATGSSASTLTVTSSNNAPLWGSTVTLTATFSATCTGSVLFLDGAVPVGTAVIAGQTASVVTLPLSVGSHNITAVYAGGSCAAITSPVLTINVGRMPVTILAASSLNPSTYGDAVTLTYTFTGMTGVTPTGTALLKDGGSTLATLTIDSSGHATYNTAALTAGAHNLQVVYSGDANYY